MDTILNCLNESLSYYAQACDEVTDEHGLHILDRLRSERARQLHDLQRAISILGKPKDGAPAQDTLRNAMLDGAAQELWSGCLLRDSRIVSAIRVALNDPLVHSGLKALVTGHQMNICMDLELLALQRGHPIRKAA